MLTVISTILVIVIILYILGAYWEKISTKNVFLDAYSNKFRINENDKIQLIIEISNKKIVLLPIIKIILNVPSNLKKENYSLNSSSNKNTYDYKMITSLLSFQKVKRRTEFIAVKRGYYLLDDITIELVDLFGISKSYLKFQNKIHFIVHPKPDNLQNLLLESTNMNGEEIVRRWIIPDPILYSGTRQYTLGDSYKDIDWKATAKLGDVHVKKYDYTSDPSIIIFFDVSVYKSMFCIDEEYVEKSIKIMASIINEVNKLNIPIGLSSNAFIKYLNKDMIFPNTGEDHIRNLYDFLACLAPYNYKKIDYLINKYIVNCLGTNNIILIIYELTIELYDIIYSLIKHNNKIKLIIYKKNDLNLNHSNITISYIV